MADADSKAGASGGSFSRRQVGKYKDWKRTVQGKLILITGAAGTGKSTLVRSIMALREPFERIDYGQLLRKRKSNPIYLETREA